MSRDVTVSPKALTVPLSIVAAGFIAWATFVTVQLFAIREELATIKATQRHIAVASHEP